MDQSTIPKSKSRSWFWPLQIGLWLFAGLFNFLLQILLFKPPVLMLALNFIILSVGGMLITSLYRYYLKRKKTKFSFSFGRFILRLTGSSFALSSVWLLLAILIYLPFFAKYHLKLLVFILNFIPFTILILIWNLFYLGYQLIKKYHLAELEKLKLEVGMQKAQLSNLKSQINPHFIFNALNNIRALILEDHQLARQMLTRFSEIFRYALQHAEDWEITIAEEINMLKQYLELVKMQYEDRLVFTIQADENLLKENVPPMILQMLVENAVKYGIALNPLGGEIYVGVTGNHHHLLLTVKNTGTLKNSNTSRNTAIVQNIIPKSEFDNGLGVGLKNITERLKLIYGEQASLQITEQSPEVVVVVQIERKHD